MTSETTGQIALEHYHRYCLARDLAAGLDVLDVASGEGYGAALLAGVARSVIGVEIDAESVRHAQHAYPFRNLRFLQGDAAQMPLPDSCVDLAVSFETLEHLPDQERFLAEVRRVLKPGGLLLVSTPDRLVYSAPGQAPNPYHVLELTGPEFSALLARHFAHHRILAQRATIGSVLAPLDEASGGWRTYESRDEGLIEAQPGLSRAVYLLGAASDAPLPPLGSSIFALNISLDEHIAAPAQLRDAQQARREAEAAEEAARAALEADSSARERQALEDARQAAQAAAAAGRAVALTQRELSRKHAALAAAQAEVAELLARIEQMRVSTSWRLTGPLRVAARQFPGIARQARRGLRLAWWTATGQLPRRLRERQAALALQQAAGAGDLRAALALPDADGPVPEPDSIRLPVAKGKPRVSIVIPSYGQVDYTLRCLASIAANPPSAPIEVIVVDDASGDPMVGRLAEVQGLRLLVWPENLGFLRSCNAAVPLAQGRFVFLLNNDTQLMPDAVDSLVRLLDARPDAAMAGAKLLYPDGRLQEAGGIIWRDGSGWNYGNGDDPRKHEYCYVREADYISGAAIMIRRTDWDAMGGFDETFLPAYCEDSDLAFRLRKAGRKVLFEPRSLVVHHEGVSHGTDLAQGVKAHQVANSRRLFERWRDTLEQDALPPGERVMRARDRALNRKLTLVVDHYVPEPDRDAGSRTMLAFIDALLAAGRCVKFLPFNLHHTSRYADDLERRGVEVIHTPWTASPDAWLAANGTEVDEILLSRPSVAKELLAPLRRHCRAPIVFYGHDLHFARLMRAPGALDTAEGRREVAATQAQERQTWRLVDMVLYPSEDEAAVVRDLEPTVPARAVPAYALAPRAAPQVAPPAAGLVFVGGFRHPPNVDAASWLATEIFPLIRAQRPEARLTIIGSHPTPEVLALADDGIEVRGFVPDAELDAAYAQARVAICPLRVGAGVKLKVVEAMHRGLPVVTTPVGAQGLPGLTEVCDVAADPADIAAAALRLLSDDALWLRRAQAQAAYASARFSPDALREALVAAFAEASHRG